MISLEQLQAGLSISLGEEIALNDTALVYIQIDQPAIESMAQSRIRWEEWDKKKQHQWSGCATNSDSTRLFWWWDLSNLR